MPNPVDPFHEPYDREEIAYGDRPSAPLAAYLAQVDGVGQALDLGAGAGRDTLALAKAGFHVTAVDVSPRGLERIEQRASEQSVTENVKTELCDVRDLKIRDGEYSVIVATTVLDHIPQSDAKILWQKIVRGLAEQGMLYVEVHTSEDPGCDREPGLSNDAPVSETASAVVNYFEPNQLVSWAADASAKLRVIQYQERLEWDYTHGAEHQHGKAILLAVRAGYHPEWFGQPPAFPRKNS